MVKSSVQVLLELDWNRLDRYHQRLPKPEGGSWTCKYEDKKLQTKKEMPSYKCLITRWMEQITGVAWEQESSKKWNEH